MSVVEQAQRTDNWTGAFLASARQLKHVAKEAENNKNVQTAAEMWRWVGCAYHAASFGFHVQPDRQQWGVRVSRLRQAARVAYGRALRFRPSWGLPVIVHCGGESIQG